MVEELLSGGYPATIVAYGDLENRPKPQAMPAGRYFAFLTDMWCCARSECSPNPARLPCVVLECVKVHG